VRYTKTVKERGNEMNYTVHYEISVGEKTIEDDMVVDAESEERAVEFAGNSLNQEYGQSNGVLLVCEVVE
jgi:hypothetical protein